jgi:hypothetical protein
MFLLVQAPAIAAFLNKTLTFFGFLLFQHQQQALTLSTKGSSIIRKGEKKIGFQQSIRYDSSTFTYLCGTPTPRTLFWSILSISKSDLKQKRQDWA